MSFNAGNPLICAGSSVILTAHLERVYQVLRVQNCEKDRGEIVSKSLPYMDSMEEVLVLELKAVQLVFDQRPRNGDLSHVLFPDRHQS